MNQFHQQVLYGTRFQLDICPPKQTIQASNATGRSVEVLQFRQRILASMNNGQIFFVCANPSRGVERCWVR